ncbi:hypothetical protein D1632_05365 [Chryseobacterium nematophagum]|uniref:Uncharacterized protein n=1 Tax=Chryseobacterium nematophagum TaxID=2305228 RepID=A0A3M7LC74_9FLAO|nr:hypothetical protein [Chryseobacterium nematophagum]RMZ60368.1 hypothetical protein D1632_05365 [Chryseobacterium nematophagum]
MSKVYTLKETEGFSIDQYNNSISTLNNIVIEKAKDQDEYWYWIDGKSSRVVIISFDEKTVEIKNMFMSSKEDYLFTNILVEKMVSLFGGKIFNEMGEKLSHLIYNEEKIETCIDEDFDLTIAMMVNEHHTEFTTVATRRIYLGPKMFNRLKHLNRELRKEAIFNTILKINYGYPDYDYGDFYYMDLDRTTEMQIYRFEPVLIKKYDSLAFIDEKNMIFITNDILNTILPEEWTLLDEYQVIAPVLSDESWEKFVNKAKNHDLWGKPAK